MRYDQCDDTCTVDCGHCKGQGPPKAEPDCAEFRENGSCIHSTHMAQAGL